GGDDAATIYAYFTAGSNEDAFKADTSLLATSSSIAALNDFNPLTDTVARVTLVDTTTDLTNQTASGPTAQEIVDAWGNQPQASYTTSGTLGFYLDAQVSSAGSGGSGLYQATVRVQDTSNDALQGARINVDGTTLTLTTNSQGEVTFNLDSGVYLLEVSPPAGYDTPIGQVLTITAGDPADTVFTLSPSDPDAGGCTPPWLG
ncbi:MAG: carboxypeptidase-like regulatory domain-containing protein, partial [Pirellulales bacterium]